VNAGKGSVGWMSLQSGMGILPMNPLNPRGTFNLVNLVARVHGQDAHATSCKPLPPLLALVILNDYTA